jgi:bifunctional non-homologous end joining protein LigD
MELVMLCQKGEFGKFPEGWLYEPKLDGARCLAGKFGDTVKLVGRHGTDYTDKFPEIVADLKTYPCDFVLDGELVGKDYSTLAGRTHLEDGFKIEMRAGVEPCDYYVFDVLVGGGSDLRSLPLKDRKEALYALGGRGHVKIVRPQPLDVLLRMVEGKRIEGIVAKDPNSRYELRRSERWVKFRPETAEDLLIIGYEDTDKKPRRPYRSLILKRGDREVQASSGLSEADLELTSRIFANEPKRQVGTKWYFERPRFVAEIEFYGGSEIPYRFPRVVKLKLENIGGLN